MYCILHLFTIVTGSGEELIRVVTFSVYVTAAVMNRTPASYNA